MSMLKMLAAAVLGALSLAAAAQQPYRFSPVNQWDIAKTATYWNPIIQYVSQHSGVPLELKIGRTSADTTAYVLAQEVEFVFSNHLFSPEREKLGWKVFGRREGPLNYGQIVVPADSPVKRLEDLRGAEVGFAGAEAFIGYKVTYGHLLNLGISVKPVFGGNQNAAFAQLFAGRVLAVGSNSPLVVGYAKREGKSFRVLWTSEGFQELALMASSKVPKEHVERVAQAFAGMRNDQAGREILHRSTRAVGLPEDAYFVRSDGSEYASYRRFYQNAPAAVR